MLQATLDELRDELAELDRRNSAASVMQAMEIPEAVSDSDGDQVMFCRAETENLKAELAKLEKQFGDPNDKRVLMAKQKVREAEERERNAQVVKPATEAETKADARQKKEVTKNSKRGSGSNRRRDE